MRLRTLHLAQLLLLLSAFGAVQPMARSAGQLSGRPACLLSALYQRCLLISADRTRLPCADRNVDASISAEMPSAAVAAADHAWTMHLPSAAAASVHTFSSFARA